MFLYLMFLFICIIQTAYFTSLWIPMQLFALTQCKIDKSAPKCWQYSINYDDNNNKLLERNLNESQHVLILGSTTLLPLGPAARFIEQTQTKPLDRPERSRQRPKCTQWSRKTWRQCDRIHCWSGPMKRWRRLRRRRRRRRSCCSKLNGSLLFFDLKRFSIENLCYIWYTTHDTRCQGCQGCQVGSGSCADCRMPKTKTGKKGWVV